LPIGPHDPFVHAFGATQSAGPLHESAQALPFALQTNGAQEIPAPATHDPWPSQRASGWKVLLAPSQLPARHAVVSS
jgi:hypothetical protein